MSLLDIDLNIKSQECIIKSWLDNNISIIKKWGQENIPGPKIEIKGNIVNILTNERLKSNWTFHIKPSVKRIPIELFRFGKVEGNIQVGSPYSYLNQDHINMIETLEGLPESCSGILCIQDAKLLKSFKGLPNYVGGDLYCEYTPIKLPQDAQYFPENVMGDVYVELNDKEAHKAVYLYEHIKNFNGRVKGYYMSVYNNGEVMKRYERIFYNPREYAEQRLKYGTINFFK